MRIINSGLQGPLLYLRCFMLTQFISVNAGLRLTSMPLQQVQWATPREVKNELLYWRMKVFMFPRLPTVTTTEAVCSLPSVCVGCLLFTQLLTFSRDTIDTWLITDKYQLPISWYTISGWGLCKGSCIIHVTWLNFTLRRLHAPTFLGIKFRLHHSQLTREESLTIKSFATLKLVVKTYCNWMIET